MNYVFGPVPSHRLGRSLGVDVVPFKTCTYDCVYCQIGRTTCKTVERKEWVPIQDVLEEVRSRLSAQPDHITLSGSGEPTLFSRIGDLIDGIKSITNIPVAVLTNGSLLWQPETQRALHDADLLLPSLDAGDETRFRHINRPHEAISFEKMLEGLIESRRVFRGQYWLEVFLLAGYTTVEAEIRKLSRCVDLIKPDRVQLNTVTRPPAEGFAEAVSRERLTQAAAMFDQPAEAIAELHRAREHADLPSSREDILNMLRRRPCSIAQIVDGLGLRCAEVVKYVEALQAEELLEVMETADGRYYKAVNPRTSRASAQCASESGK